ncbi:hypothetical protein CC85DRAFT_38503 [Cutaneotrichosporon oleaginosum]|uniref:Uncharacterized protein n=1 Tax=Cutaneotrichosporon oleaginosum TaxID=879819 RepID=A0A0J0XB43_9TREE|nr:uncharacterized protein CC85DRAFT_38503 [Cutaneotrichosporon oleaginosum]KLT38327.1 hypothetical protein CC85DRAFT_38503 [Cutaneotrichosporon oleaginosum]TXT12576.1 hypothetical protein COLE_02986 [Cutaneotrichosporon oleaginosum]
MDHMMCVIGMSPSFCYRPERHGAPRSRERPLPKALAILLATSPLTLTRSHPVGGQRQRRSRLCAGWDGSCERLRTSATVMVMNTTPTTDMASPHLQTRALVQWARRHRQLGLLPAGHEHGTRSIPPRSSGRRPELGKDMAGCVEIESGSGRGESEGNRGDSGVSTKPPDRMRPDN